MNEGHPDEISETTVCWSFRVLFTRFCIKDAVTVRGGVLKFTLAVDNDTTLHGVHTDMVAFSLAVQIKCSICSYHQSLTRAPHDV